jgi:transposase
VIVYRIAAGRGFDDAAVVLGDYAGVLERDGWAPYRRFAAASHQTCLAHLLRRCRGLLADAQRGQAKTPHAVRRILQRALAVRDGRDAGELDDAEVAAQAERLGVAVDKLIAGRTVYAPNRRLLDHLGRERDALFTFLAQPGVQATNWRAEHAIRPAVVTRKVWGGNRTWTGAVTWQVLSSVLATATCSGTTRSPCWCRCCAPPGRSWPTLPSPAPPAPAPLARPEAPESSPPRPTQGSATA